LPWASWRRTSAVDRACSRFQRLQVRPQLKRLLLQQVGAHRRRVPAQLTGHFDRRRVGPSEQRAEAVAGDRPLRFAAPDVVLELQRRQARSRELDRREVARSHALRVDRDDLVEGAERLPRELQIGLRLLDVDEGALNVEGQGADGVLLLQLDDAVSVLRDFHPALALAAALEEHVPPHDAFSRVDVAVEDRGVRQHDARRQHRVGPQRRRQHPCIRCRQVVASGSEGEVVIDRLRNRPIDRERHWCLRPDASGRNGQQAQRRPDYSSSKHESSPQKAGPKRPPYICWLNVGRVQDPSNICCEKAGSFGPGVRSESAGDRGSAGGTNATAVLAGREADERGDGTRWIVDAHARAAIRPQPVAGRSGSIRSTRANRRPRWRQRLVLQRGMRRRSQAREMAGAVVRPHDQVQRAKAGDDVDVAVAIDVVGHHADEPIARGSIDGCGKPGRQRSVPLTIDGDAGERHRVD
jgi:hypothetical protein